MTGEELGRLFEGKTLEGRYHLKRMLAAGTFGAVFHGQHRIFEDVTVREVAIKITLETGLTKGEVKQKFGEAIWSARVYDSLEGSGATKYLVPAHDLGILHEHEDRGFIVMGLVRGVGSTPARCEPPKTLAETVRNWQETGMFAAIDLMKRVCEAVGALHEQGVIHRDLKPDNILTDEHGQIRLVDLGLAADLEPDGYAYGSAGTHLYMAPETGIESRSNRASDVYALGIILYELLTGLNPFEGLTPPLELALERHGDWMQREKASVPVLPPSAYGKRVEEWQDRLVLRCLSPKNSARPQSAKELRRLIEAGGKEEGPSIDGTGWAAWFGQQRDWAAEAARLKPFLDQWGRKHRDAIWLEAATKLAVCYLSIPDSDMPRIEELLNGTEELVEIGVGVTTFKDRAVWYGGLADVMEIRGRAGILRSRYRDEQRVAASKDKT